MFTLYFSTLDDMFDIIMFRKEMFSHFCCCFIGNLNIYIYIINIYFLNWVIWFEILIKIWCISLWTCFLFFLWISFSSSISNKIVRPMCPIRAAIVARSEQNKCLHRRLVWDSVFLSRVVTDWMKCLGISCSCCPSGR